MSESVSSFSWLYTAVTELSKELLEEMKEDLCVLEDLYKEVT